MLGMPSYTAPVGHWSEPLLDEAAARIGPDADRDVVKALLIKAATEIELLSGRSFGRAGQQTVTIDAGGLPFAELRDAHVAGFESSVDTWPVPDPVNPQFAVVLQLGRFANLPDRAIPTWQALFVAGQLVAWANQAGLLSPQYLLWRLGNAPQDQQSST